MEYHIVNGDALAEKFPLSDLGGRLVVMREALIDGSLAGENSEEFWQNRANHHYVSLQSYKEMVVSEIEKVQAASADTTLCFWFGYDLFCQVNLWFLLSQIRNVTAENINVVYPSFLQPEDRWQEFGKANTQELIFCFKNRIGFTSEDLHLARELWTAYKNNELEQLARLSYRPSSCFPSLRLVCQAHIDRFPGENERGRPERVVEDILRDSGNDFYKAFTLFFEREGVYGFGDVQFKRIYDRVLNSAS